MWQWLPTSWAVGLGWESGVMGWLAALTSVPAVAFGLNFLEPQLPHL